MKKAFLFGALVVLVAGVCLAGFTHFSSIELLDDLIVGDDATVSGDLAVTGSTTATGGVTIEGLVGLDSSLYLGNTTRWNGGVYVKVQNKSGETLRAGAVVQWDGTLILIEEANGDSADLEVAVATADAEGGYYGLFWTEDGSGTPSNDTLFVTGTDYLGTARVDSIRLNGANDTAWSQYIWSDVSAMQSRDMAASVTTDIKIAPLWAVTTAAVLADGDSTSVKSYCGVIYPSTIVDNASGWMLVQGYGKVLFVGLDGGAFVGTGLDVDADSLGVASKNALSTGNDVLNGIGYSMSIAEPVGTPVLLPCFVDFR